MKNLAILFLLLFNLLAGCESHSDSSGSVGSEPINPVRIAAANENTLLVSDYQAQALRILDSDSLATISNLKLDGFPLAVGYDQGKIFVGNETSQCVEVYDSDGQKLYEFEGGPGSIPVPNDLAIDAAADRVFVVDSANNRIAVFSTDGTLLSTITDASLLRPVGVALDQASQLLYVSDLGRKVLVFSYAGVYQRTISGSFSGPQGLALDDSNHLFVVDAEIGQVLVFDLVTDLEVYRFGTPGEYAGPHKMPMDLIFDSVTQTLFVTDFLAKQVDRYTISEMTP